MHDKSLKELCGQLSISIATGRNWVKLGKITPQYIKNGVPYFDEKHIAIIENEIRSGKNVALKSRRNKKICFRKCVISFLCFPKLQEPYRFAETALRDNTGTNSADL